MKLVLTGPSRRLIWRYIMSFNFGGLLEFIYYWSGSLRWTLRRLLVFLAFILVFPVLQLFVWAGLLLDNLFFRAYRDQKIKSPVFITGNFRSGTTFLHRLLAKDTRRFNTMLMWEILFSPSITQRRIFSALSIILGAPVRFLLNRVEKDWHKKNRMHKVSFQEPEEDEYLLLHIWSAMTTGLSSGLLRLAEPYVFFDRKLPGCQRQSIMEFYKRCVQRHMYARSDLGAQYLAKNPALCPKLETLDEAFPDNKVIYLVRSPFEVIPSFLNMMLFSWRVVGVKRDPLELKKLLLQMTRHWYDYPLEYLSKKPQNTYAVVKYDDLVAEPEETVKVVYAKLGWEMDKTFADTLREEASGSRAYRSQHDYSLESVGLSKEEIVSEFCDIFEKFGFTSD